MLVYFYKTLLLSVPPYNTILKLLAILFVLKLYARINTFKLSSIYDVFGCVSNHKTYKMYIIYKILKWIDFS